MVTVTLSVYDSRDLGLAIIRDALEEIPGEEGLMLAYGNGDKVVVKNVKGCEYQLASQIYCKLAVRAHVVNIQEDDDDEEEDDDDDDKADDKEEDDEDDEDDDEKEDDDEDGDGDGDGDDDSEDEDDEAEDDDDTYVQMSSLSLYGTGLPATAIREPSWEDQPVADPSRIYFYNDTGLPATAIPEPSWEDQPVQDPTRIYFYNM